jgi:hypothetical protein
MAYNFSEFDRDERSKWMKSYKRKKWTQRLTALLAVVFAAMVSAWVQCR